jgi:uncharacterized YccA/Bax inhibitor family protein
MRSDSGVYRFLPLCYVPVMTLSHAANPMIRHPDWKVPSDSSQSDRATFEGALTKSLFLLIFGLCAGVAFDWIVTVNFEGNSIRYGLGWAVFFAPAIALILYFGAIARPQISKFAAFPFALSLACLCGLFGAIADRGEPGIGLQVVIYTFAGLIGVLFCYRFQLIPTNDAVLSFGLRVSTGIVAALAADTATSILIGPYHSIFTRGSPATMSMLLVLTLLAAFALLIDLSLIREKIETGADKATEWNAAISITACSVWMYLSLLALIGGKRR